MALEFAGIAVDVAVTDLTRAEEFYTTLMGRRFDLEARPDQREWRLHADPEVVLRITADPANAGHGTAAIGVSDLTDEHVRLARHWPDLPPVQRKPGVIALLRLPDPDSNTVVLWQDLLDRGNRNRSTMPVRPFGQAVSVSGGPTTGRDAAPGSPPSPPGSATAPGGNDAR